MDSLPDAVDSIPCLSCGNMRSISTVDGRCSNVSTAHLYMAEAMCPRANKMSFINNVSAVKQYLQSKGIKVTDSTPVKELHFLYMMEAENEFKKKSVKLVNNKPADTV